MFFLFALFERPAQPSRLEEFFIGHAGTVPISRVAYELIAIG
jgi:hypothetical protein